MNLPISKCLAFCCATAASLILVGHASAELGQVIPMGDLERWAVLSLGSNSSNDRLSGSALVQGDFGAAGAGSLTVKDNATISGNVYYGRGRSERIAGSGTMTGTRFRDQDFILNDAVNEAMAASEAAANFAATRNFSQINLEQSQNLGLSGAPGETVVLSLRDFRMSGNSTLTLQGAPDTTFIINVTRQFSLSDNARIVLAGGVSWNDVLFNVRGKGSSVRLSGNAWLEGILLANQRSVRLRDQAVIQGELIADSVRIQGAGQINHPAVVSP